MAERMETQMALRPNNATLLSLQGVLPVEYVRLVLSQIHECERSLGDTQVRVSLNAEIEPPHYRINAVMDIETGEATNWKSFHGKTHKPLSARQSSGAIWSGETMTFRQVSDLIGAMRNYRPRPPEAKARRRR